MAAFSSLLNDTEVQGIHYSVSSEIYIEHTDTEVQGNAPFQSDLCSTRCAITAMHSEMCKESFNPYPPSPSSSQDLCVRARVHKTECTLELCCVM